MKSTGIVRRIDDLGRIVIPKEIRRSMRVKEGEPLEIFTKSKNGRYQIILEKYQVESIIEDDLVYLRNSLFDNFEMTRASAIAIKFDELLAEIRKGEK